MSDVAYLVIGFEDFCNKVSDLISKGNEIILFPAHTEDEFTSLNKQFIEWVAAGNDLFSHSFSNFHNDFATSFQKAGINPFMAAMARQKDIRPVKERTTALKQEIKEKIALVNRSRKLIDNCDYIRLGEKFDISSREKYTVKQKARLVLSKLYELNDGTRHPINLLMIGNGLKLKNDGEPREIAQMLADSQLIDIMGGLGKFVFGKITSAGSMEVEEAREQVAPINAEMPNEKDLFNSNMAEVLEFIRRTDAAHEVLFDELQEIKDLHGKIPEKNLGELIKGKLVNLVVDKVISFDVADFIFYKITGHKMNLLG